MRRHNFPTDRIISWSKIHHRRRRQFSIKNLSCCRDRPNILRQSQSHHSWKKIAQRFQPPFSDRNWFGNYDANNFGVTSQVLALFCIRCKCIVHTRSVHQLGNLIFFYVFRVQQRFDLTPLWQQRSNGSGSGNGGNVSQNRYYDRRKKNVNNVRLTQFQLPASACIECGEWCATCSRVHLLCICITCVLCDVWCINHTLCENGKERKRVREWVGVKACGRRHRRLRHTTSTTIPHVYLSNLTQN